MPACDVPVFLEGYDPIASLEAWRRVRTRGDWNIRPILSVPFGGVIVRLQWIVGEESADAFVHLIERAARSVQEATWLAIQEYGRVNTVILADATKSSRSLARAVATAVSSLRDRTRTPQFQPGLTFWLVGNKETIERVMQSDEVKSPVAEYAIVPDNLFGLPVKIDSTTRDGILLVLDPSSYTSETVEVL